MINTIKQKTAVLIMSRASVYGLIALIFATAIFYVYFANRCPMYGKLYDQLSIVNIETGDVEYCLAPRCGHTGMTELWFKGKTLQANGLKELYKLNIALAE